MQKINITIALLRLAKLKLYLSAVRLNETTHERQGTKIAVTRTIDGRFASPKKTLENLTIDDIGKQFTQLEEKYDLQDLVKRLGNGESLSNIAGELNLSSEDMAIISQHKETIDLIAQEVELYRKGDKFKKVASFFETYSYALDDPEEQVQFEKGYKEYPTELQMAIYDTKKYLKAHKDAIAQLKNPNTDNIAAKIAGRLAGEAVDLTIAATLIAGVPLAMALTAEGVTF